MTDDNELRASQLRAQREAADRHRAIFVRLLRERGFVVDGEVVTPPPGMGSFAVSEVVDQVSKLAWDEARRSHLSVVSVVPVAPQAPSGETYLSDGVYVSFDGYQLWLRVEREEGRHERVALDPRAWSDLLRYVSGPSVGWKS